jgi:hypothetical protein
LTNFKIKSLFTAIQIGAMFASICVCGYSQANDSLSIERASSLQWARPLALLHPTQSTRALVLSNSSEPVVNLENRQNSWPLATYSTALEQCQVNESDLNYELSRLFNFNESPMMSYLSQLYPEITDNLLKKISPLQILVDSISSYTWSAGNKDKPQLYPHKTLRGIYLSKKENKISYDQIVLDCDLVSRQSWPSLFSHEMAHHMNRNRNLASWMDELLAQHLEVKSANQFPVARLKTLENSAVVPSFFSSQKLFQSSEVYAVNLLFGLYLNENFGGSKLIATLTNNIQNLTDLSQRMLEFIEGQIQFDYVKKAISSKGLIRHFVLAVNVNAFDSKNTSIFKISKWNGFKPSALLTEKQSFSLEPGGFARVHKDLISNSRFVSWASKDVEIYRIQKQGPFFKIITAKQFSASQDEKVWEEDYFLLINVNETQAMKIDL